MAEEEEEGDDELPCVDHDPLNEGAVGKRLSSPNFLSYGTQFPL